MKLPLLLALLFTTCPFALAQPAAKAAPEVTASAHSPDTRQTRTFHLKYTTQPADINELSALLRQQLGNGVVPGREALVFAMPDQNAIVIRGNAEDLALAERNIADLDHPKKSWRLTYTLTEMDGDKRVGTQHYSMVMTSGQQSSLKQGDRVPIATGSHARSGEPASQTQFNYQDVGMSFTATLDELHDGGARLRSDVEKTGLADEKSGFGQQDPIFRSSGLKGEATLAPGKPLILGAMDIPGSTHHLQIEALMEPLP